MDINLNYSEGDTPIALKSDFILSFCELIMGGKNGLEAVEKTLIDRAVISVYRNYLADPKPENMPILGDLYDEWKSHATLTLLANQDLPTFGYNMIDPLKPWCWGSILFYPFKISRFS